MPQKKTPNRKLKPIATVRFKTDELDGIAEGIDLIRAESGVTVTMGTYVKHAALRHLSYRQMENALRTCVLSSDIAINVEDIRTILDAHGVG